MYISKLVVLLVLGVFGTNGEEANVQDQKTFALSINIREQVGKKTLPAQGFLVIKPNHWQSPKHPSATRLYLAYGGVYCIGPAGGGKTAVDSITFVSTRQNLSFRLPLSGEKSLSKFWVSESLTIEATINSDGTVKVTTKPTRIPR